MDSLPAIENIEAYMLRSIKNKIYDQFDKIHSREKLEKHLARHVPLQSSNTEEEVSYSETLQLVNDEIEQLPNTTKKVFQLSRFDRYTNEEIAEQLRLSGKSVEYHITRALKRLRLRLNIF